MNPDTINKNIDENFKSTLKLYMGRQYKFNIKSDKIYIIIYRNEENIPIEVYEDLKK